MIKRKLSLLALGIALVLTPGCGKEDTLQSVSNNTVIVEAPTETVEETPTDEEVVKLEPQPDNTELPPGKIKFVYDANESQDEYLESKLSIQGSGTVIDLQGNMASSSSSEKYDQDKATQQFWHNQAEDRDSYYYAVKGYDWGKGFGPVTSVKYDIIARGANDYMAFLEAPNNTDITITEKDPNVGDAKHWQTDILSTRGFSYLNLIMGVDTLEHNTPYILGTGLKDWSPYEYSVGPEDLTVVGNTQLLCSIFVENQFGEGYYFEFADVDTGLFESYMILQRGDRVFCINAKSDYRESMKDICTAVADRCIIVY